MSELLPVEEALRRVLELVRSKPLERREVGESMGRVLVQPVLADRDLPPWTKSMMDGYAVRAQDLRPDSPFRRQGCWELQTVGELTAGQVCQHPLEPGQAVRIMTGAPLPPGADAVVMVEYTESVVHAQDPQPRRLVRIKRPVQPGENVLPQGAVLSQGAEVLPAGWVLRPQDAGLLAEVGATQVLVAQAPRVAILATGDELVPADHTPGPGQIRNSNGPMLEALVRQAGGVPVCLGIAQDRFDLLTQLIRQGLQSDLLLLTGGVSKGIRDLVPEALCHLGVQPLLRGVALKPGKPLWVGVHRRNATSTLVFGLPGNPMSTLVCFELFVRPVLRAMSRHPQPRPQFLPARLDRPWQHAGSRTTFHPAWLTATDQGWIVTPVRWQGSADIQVLARANALLRLEQGRPRWDEGELVPVLPLPGGQLGGVGAAEAEKEHTPQTPNAGSNQP